MENEIEEMGFEPSSEMKHRQKQIKRYNRVFGKIDNIQYLHRKPQKYDKLAKEGKKILETSYNVAEQFSNKMQKGAVELEKRRQIHENWKNGVSGTFGTSSKGSLLHRMMQRKR